MWFYIKIQLQQRLISRKVSRQRAYYRTEWWFSTILHAASYFCKISSTKILFTSLLSKRGNAQIDSVNCIFASSLANNEIIGVLTALAECIRPPSQQNNILAFPVGISNQTELTKLHLSEFSSASSHHTVGESALDHGSLEKINTKYRQGIFSTTLDDLHEKWNLPLPDYIKIDVDGIEHKIIEGCNKILKNKKLSSLLIEINENRKEDLSIIKKLKKFNFNFDKEQVDKSRRKDGPHKGYAEYLFYK